MVSPDSRATACPLSGRNSTYRPVQILQASSELVKPHFPGLRINEDEVRALANLKPSYEVKQLVDEDFPEAREKIAFEALK
jgi:hypothetical protein